MLNGLANTFKQLPEALLQDSSTPLKQLGSLYLNLSRVLGHQQLSPAELLQLLTLLLSKELAHEQLIGTAKWQEQQAQQQGADDKTANIAQHAVAEASGILPWHTLVISNQPLGLEGLLQVCQLLDTPQQLRSLVVADCEVCGSFTGGVVHAVMAGNHHMLPQWVRRLQWLDLSNNCQLQLLKPGDASEVIGLARFLDVAEQLQGLCLQHTGLTSTQLSILLEVLDILFTEDNLAEQISDGSSSRPLQCLKLGPIVPDQDINSVAAVAAAQGEPSSHLAGWPHAAFDDLLNRLVSYEAPMNQMVVLELHGLSQQQEHQLHDWVSYTKTLLRDQPAQQQVIMANPLAAGGEPHVDQSHQSCCRLSWLRPGQLLKFEVPVPGLSWQLPPPKLVPTPPVQAADAVDPTPAAAPFSMPAQAAARPADAESGWMRPPPATTGRQQQQQPRRAAAGDRQGRAAVAGSRSVLDASLGPANATHSSHNSRHRPRAVAAGATAAGASPQPSSKRRQQPQQQQHRHRTGRVEEQHHPKRAKQRQVQQQGITDHFDFSTEHPLVFERDIEFNNTAPVHGGRSLQRQQEHRWDAAHATVGMCDEDDDFMQAPSSSRREQRHRRSRNYSLAAAGAAVDEICGLFLGSQDTGGTLAAAGDGEGAARGVLADLLCQHHDDVFTDTDSEEASGGEASGRIERNDAGGDLSSVPEYHRCAQQQHTSSSHRQQRRRKRGRKHMLQPIHFDADNDTVIAGAGGWSGSPLPGLAPLESPLSPLGPDTYTPDSAQRHSPDHSAAAAAAEEDEDSAAQQGEESDTDSCKWLAGDEEQNLARGIYSQDEASQGSRSQGDGDDDGQGQQRGRSQRPAVDDDPEGLRAFGFERTKRPGQGLGPKGQQVFGMPTEGERRRQGAMNDKVIASLEQIRSRYERQQPAVAESSQRQQQQGRQQVPATAGAAGSPVVSAAARHWIVQPAGWGSGRRAGQRVRNRFVDDAAGGGGAYGHEEEELSSGSSRHSSDSDDEQPPYGDGMTPANKTADDRRGTRAAPAVSGHYAVNLDDGDDSVRLRCLTDAAGNKHKRRRVALIDSEPQDEVGHPLEELKEQQQQQQQQHAHESTSGARSNVQQAVDEPAVASDSRMQDSCKQQLKAKKCRSSHGRTPRQQAATTTGPPAALTPPAAASEQQPGNAVVLCGAESAPDQSHDAASDDEPEGLETIPECRQWREAETEVHRLQEMETEIHRQLEAARAMAAGQSAPGTTAADAASGTASVKAPEAAPQQEDQAPELTLSAPSPAHLDAQGLPPSTGPVHAAAAAGTSADDIASLQQQLRQVKAERLKKQRLVRLLKNAVPYSWDTKGNEARAFKRMNVPQALKRQSRAPTRLSPGAIEQQERLIRQAQQQQHEAAPFVPAAVNPRQRVGPSSRQNHRSAGKTTDGSRFTTNSSSSSSSSSESDSQDDLPLAQMCNKAWGEQSVAERPGLINVPGSSICEDSSSDDDDDNGPLASRKSVKAAALVMATAAAAGGGGGSPLPAAATGASVAAAVCSTAPRLIAMPCPEPAFTPQAAGATADGGSPATDAGTARAHASIHLSAVCGSASPAPLAAEPAALVSHQGFPSAVAAAAARLAQLLPLAAARAPPQTQRGQAVSTAADAATAKIDAGAAPDAAAAACTRTAALLTPETSHQPAPPSATVTDVLVPSTAAPAATAEPKKIQARQLAEATQSVVQLSVMPMTDAGLQQQEQQQQWEHVQEGGIKHVEHNTELPAAVKRLGAQQSSSHTMAGATLVTALHMGRLGSQQHQETHLQQPQLAKQAGLQAAEAAALQAAAPVPASAAAAAAVSEAEDNAVLAAAGGGGASEACGVSSSLLDEDTALMSMLPSSAAGAAVAAAGMQIGPDAGPAVTLSRLQAASTAPAEAAAAAAASEPLAAPLAAVGGAPVPQPHGGVPLAGGLCVLACGHDEEEQELVIPDSQEGDWS